MEKAWETAHRRFKIAAMLEESSKAFGPEFRADEAHMLAKADLWAKHGSPARGAESPAYLAAIKDAENQRSIEQDALDLTFYDPVLEAAQELARTPAPDMDALRFKIELIKERELQLYAGTEDVFEVVQADAERLAA